jgi:hypothetical protein
MDERGQDDCKELGLDPESRPIIDPGIRADQLRPVEHLPLSLLV